MSRFTTQQDVRERPGQASTQPILTSPSNIGGDVGQEQAAAIKLIDAATTLAVRVKTEDAQRRQAFELNNASGALTGLKSRVQDDPSLSPTERAVEYRNGLNEIIGSFSSDETKNKFVPFAANLTSQFSSQLSNEIDSLKVIEGKRGQLSVTSSLQLPEYRDFVESLGLSSNALEEKLILDAETRVRAFEDVKNILGGKKRFPVSEQENRKFVKEAQDIAGSTPSEIATVYATNPEARERALPKAVVDVIKNADPEERNLALFNLQIKDGTGDEAERVAQEVGTDAEALFSATRHLIPGTEQYNAEVEAATNPAYVDLTKLAKVRTEGTKKKVGVTSISDIANAIGVAQSSVNIEMATRFRKMFWHEVGKLASEDDSPTKREEIFSLAAARTGERMKAERIIPPVISGRPVSKLLTFDSPDAFKALESVVEKVESGRTARVSLEDGGLDVFNQVPLTMPFTNPSMIFKKPDALVDKAFLSSGKQYFPVKIGNPTVAFVEFNPSGEAKAIMIGTDEFEAIIKNRDTFPEEYSDLADTRFKWRPDYNSTFIDEVDGPDSTVIREGVRLLIHNAYFDKYNKAMDKTDPEAVTNFKAEELRILGLNDWDGFTRPKNNTKVDSNDTAE